MITRIVPLPNVTLVKSYWWRQTRGGNGGHIPSDNFRFPISNLKSPLPGGDTGIRGKHKLTASPFSASPCQSLPANHYFVAFVPLPEIVEVV